MSCTSVVSLLAYIADIQQRLIIRRQVSILDTYIITYSEYDKADVHITTTRIVHENSNQGCVYGE